MAAKTINEENLFSALGLPNAEERQVKMQLSIRIESIIKEQGLTQAVAAEVTGMAQSDISNIVRGRTSGFTLDRMLDAINRLGYGIDIVVKTIQEDAAQTRVSLA